jgi:hypothetical protein
VDRLSAQPLQVIAGVPRLDDLTDEELMRIAAGGRQRMCDEQEDEAEDEGGSRGG